MEFLVSKVHLSFYTRFSDKLRLFSQIPYKQVQKGSRSLIIRLILTEQQTLTVKQALLKIKFRLIFYTYTLISYFPFQHGMNTASYLPYASLSLFCAQHFCCACIACCAGAEKDGSFSQNRSRYHHLPSTDNHSIGPTFSIPCGILPRTNQVTTGSLAVCKTFCAIFFF